MTFMNMIRYFFLNQQFPMAITLMFRMVIALTSIIVPMLVILMVVSIDTIVIPKVFNEKGKDPSTGSHVGGPNEGRREPNKCIKRKVKISLLWWMT